ncbi:LPXTG cell wall anchor domain-containing protein [Microbacterium sp. VKM Ac-2870]|uniref:LPXTG cell wall anchor domain-containing protein n=1 Tax=Microbacterium sp. VKM Ac-2870 TaxID=2783825 RepID=UPI00188CE7C8|nr:LPXTG cell wall anchor domain-containing protein [Microbacterium sp. VKM Ac-2870]MBF4563298.1 LPXTG cell wall anchor domain-containing protein [Microbacterium sp. VKM Ac-2870]
MSRSYPATHSRTLRRVNAAVAAAALSVLSVATLSSAASAADAPWVPKTDVVFGPIYDDPNFDCELPGNGKGEASEVGYVSGSIAEGERMTGLYIDGKRMGDNSLHFLPGTHTYTYTVENLNSSTTDPKETADISGSFTIKRCDTTPTVTPATATASFSGALIDNVPTVQYTITYDAGTEGAGDIVIAVTDAPVTSVHFDGSGTQSGSFAYRCGAATFFLAIQGHDTVSGTPYPVSIPCAVDNGGTGSTGGTESGASAGTGTGTGASTGGTTSLASNTTSTATTRLPDTGLNSAATGALAAGSAAVLLLGLLSLLLARRTRRAATR